MAETTFHLTIQTPEHVSFDGEVVSLKLTNETGDLEILPQHASLMGTISFSNTLVRTVNSEEEYLMRNGLVIVDGIKNHTTVLVAGCDLVSHADLKTIREYQQFILEKLANTSDLNRFQITYLEEHGEALSKMIEVVSGRKNE